MSLPSMDERRHSTAAAAVTSTVPFPRTKPACSDGHAAAPLAYALPCRRVAFFGAADSASSRSLAATVFGASSSHGSGASSNVGIANAFWGWLLTAADEDDAAVTTGDFGGGGGDTRDAFAAVDDEDAAAEDFTGAAAVAEDFTGAAAVAEDFTGAAALFFGAMMVLL
jgi:hypothetical protein